MLLTTLGSIGSVSGFKTLSPDEWGASPWYPLLALKELEEAAYPIVKGRKKILKSLKKTRQKREWVISNYYWALWKWRMKEIHDESFKFTPVKCIDSLHGLLTTPVPPHILQQTVEEEDDVKPQHNARDPEAISGDLTKLPPPVSSLAGEHTRTRLSDKGESILQAIIMPGVYEGPRCPSRREAILQALTNDAYA